MRMLWWIPLSLVVIGAGVVWRARRNRRDVEITPGPVSGQWLAEARSREEYHW
jgi:cytochrome c-type biogenesis protein CcmH/NrfF